MTWVEQLRCHQAVYGRAPSAHNSQPWRVDYRADEIVIGVDPARALPGSDPTGRDLALGLGACVESCLIVAAGLGLAVAPARGPRLVPAKEVYRTPFTAADLQARRVARGPYVPGTLDPAVLAELGPGLVALPAHDLVDDLAAADRWMFGTPAVAAELQEWLRLHPDHPRYALDGLTDRALELSRAEAVLLGAALRGYPLARRLGLPAILAATGRSLLRGDGTVLVLTSEGCGGSGGSDDERVDAGRRLLQIWLALARRGLAVHPLSQLIDCPDTAARLAERVGALPLAVFRVGTPTGTPVRSARLPVAPR